tara:strand:- start:274 stop:855 length:582 start_codon:yes stop_codon:yes gene_type:complete
MYNGGLKKEFKKSDVKRIRNLVRKDHTNKTKNQSGYKKSFILRKEGDIWEENGKNWTIKNGIKQNITKLDKVKKRIRIPLSCPKCDKALKHYLHINSYKISGMCMNCYIDFEAKLKQKGLYKEHTIMMKKGNLNYYIKGMESVLEEVKNADSYDSYVTEQGDIEDWKVNKSSVKRKEVEKITEYLDLMKSMLD